MLSINQEKCIQCEACVQDCHRQAITIEDGVVKHDPSKCMWCGHCLAVCPRDCIIIDGDGYDCEEVEDLGFVNNPNKFQIRNLILARRSCRHFTDTEVTDEELQYILEAGKYSPTGMNLQGNAFVAVKGAKIDELLEDTISTYKKLLDAGQIAEPMRMVAENICSKFDEEKEDNIFYGANVVIFCFADTDVDGAIAATNMGWMAQIQQLGYCFERIPVLAFSDPEFAAKWAAPENKKCVIALAIGNPEPEYFCSVPRKTPPVTIF